MLGIGSIYERFRSGELDSDDEVAGVVDPDEGHRAGVPSEYRPALQLVPDPKRVDAESALRHVALHQPALCTETRAAPAALDFRTGP